MTIDEFREEIAGKMMLTPADVSKATGIHPSNIVAMAREGRLPFEPIFSGSHVKIPAGAFMAWWSGQQAKAPGDGFGTFRIEFRADTMEDLVGAVKQYLKGYEKS